VTTPTRLSAVARVSAAYARMGEVDRPEIWISVRPRAEALRDAARVDRDRPGPLSGCVIAVKDNIDVAGMMTTAGCPAFAFSPERDAPSVAALRAAGAIIVGKTNLDQFATGLVGTRSPYGAVRDAWRPDHVSGGSSSGSAVAAALGIVDVALGTDTAGSGRVPAAFQGVIGIKPTYGLVSSAGVVPACRTLDCVAVFATDPALAQTALWTMAGVGDASALPPRPWPHHAPLAAPAAPGIAVPTSAQLAGLSGDGRRAFAAAVDRWVALGATVTEVDIEPLLAAGRLLYGGAFIAERWAAVGAFIAAHPDDVDPTVAAIIASAAEIPAARLVTDTETLQRLAAASADRLAGVDALLTPTVARQPTIAEVAADPVAVNAGLGHYTTFVNLLDMCAVALPAGDADGGRFGVSLVAPAFADRVLADLAARFLADSDAEADAEAPPTAGAPRGITVFVVGAHRRGQPLHHQLSAAGARFAGVVHTTPDYRMHALATEPPKPGLSRVHSGGAVIEGELWELPSAALGPFLAALPAPMTLGQVTLGDGRSVVGFGCETVALDGAQDITAHGSWLAYLAARA
jgi:allophanate hydrolase